MNDMRSAWNRESKAYQARQETGTDVVHYGPWAPREDDLGLLGDVRNRHILEIGCGGGQNAIALAAQGAVVIAQDLSDDQLAWARARAESRGVAVRFVQGDAADLAPIPHASQDLVLSTYAFAYIERMDACLRHCARVLKPGGQLIFSLDHPIRACFHDDQDGGQHGGQCDDREEDVSIFPVRSYFNHDPLHWTFSQTRMVTYHRTIADWCDLLAQARLRLARVLEPTSASAMLDATWPEDGALAPLRLIPQTIIFVAEKGPG